VNKSLLTCVGLLLAAGAAAANTDCRISTAGGISFGVYDVLSTTPNDSLTTVVAICTRNAGPRNVSITLQLNPGSNGSSVNARRMMNTGPAGGYLNYGLFRDPGRTSVWGFSAGFDTLSQTVDIDNNASAAVTFTIYARIPPLQDVAIGSYTDSITVTISP
jgi:spore coat protein U-like protein